MSRPTTQTSHRTRMELLDGSDGGGLKSLVSARVILQRTEESCPLLAEGIRHGEGGDFIILDRNRAEVLSVDDHLLRTSKRAVLRSLQVLDRHWVLLVYCTPDGWVGGDVEWEVLLDALRGSVGYVRPVLVMDEPGTAT